MMRILALWAVLFMVEGGLCFGHLEQVRPSHRSDIPAFASFLSSKAASNLHTTQFFSKAAICSTRRVPAAQGLHSQLKCKAEAPEKEAVNENLRLLGSRRLAAAKKVIVSGEVEKEFENQKLLGSKRLAKATDIVLHTPSDKNKMLGSRRLRQVREILMERMSTTGAEGEDKLLGSRRIQKARMVLKRTVEEMDLPNRSLISKFRNALRGRQKESLTVTLERTKKKTSPPPAAAKPSTEAVQSEGSMLVVKGKAGPVKVGEAVVKKEEEKQGGVRFTSKVANEKQLGEIAAVKEMIGALTEEEKEDMSPWIDKQEDVDIFRYLLAFKTVDNVIERMKETARWRVREGVDAILTEDLSDCFEPGKEEMLYLPLDADNRPILLYRSALHDPKRLDPVRFTRYVIQATERAMVQYRLGKERESVVLVDRIGSGLKNQDPALLRELVPVILNHYPYLVGAVYIAPISPVFNIIWAILKTFLDAEAQQRFVLCKGDYSATLQKFIPDAGLSDTLGGSLNVTQWILDQQAVKAADGFLAALEQDMATESATGQSAIVYDGQPASEDEIINIAAIRVNIAGESAESRAQMSEWIGNLHNGDILRYLRAHATVEDAWEAIRRSAKWRKEENIDGILEEDLSNVMEAEKEEFYFTGVDKGGRPVLVYRSALHTPGVIDEERYKRYVVQRVEQGRERFGLSRHVAATVIIDRVGSGLKNQDPALLRVVIPCFTQHYPGTIGRIIVAPTNNIFFIVWKLASLLLDEKTRNSVSLLDKKDYTAALCETMDASVLPKNLGGDCAVPESGIY